MINCDTITLISKGNPSFLIKMIALYLEDFSSYLRQFSIAWANHDIHEVRRMAHKMKSPACTIEVIVITALLDKAEVIEEITESDGLCDDLEEAYQLVELQLLEKLEHLKKNSK